MARLIDAGQLVSSPIHLDQVITIDDVDVPERAVSAITERIVGAARGAHIHDDDRVAGRDSVQVGFGVLICPLHYSRLIPYLRLGPRESSVNFTGQVSRHDSTNIVLCHNRWPTLNLAKIRSIGFDRGSVKGPTKQDPCNRMARLMNGDYVFLLVSHSSNIRYRF